jgi:hypothetical protein
MTSKMKQENINEKLRQALISEDIEVVKIALEKISETGNRFYLPLLFDLLNSMPEHEVEVEITKLIGSVKNRESVNTFMRAIEDEKYKPIRKKLIAACWQNGLDFSNFLPVFIDIVIEQEWEVAFEAFTLIDNLEYLPGEEIINISRLKITEALPAATEQKRYFLTEIEKKLE